MWDERRLVPFLVGDFPARKKEMIPYSRQERGRRERVTEVHEETRAGGPSWDPGLFSLCPRKAQVQHGFCRFADGKVRGIRLSSQELGSLTLKPCPGLNFSEKQTRKKEGGNSGALCSPACSSHVTPLRPLPLTCCATCYMPGHVPGHALPGPTAESRWPPLV